MTVSRSLLLAASVFTLAACGASSTSAPIVYGTQPAQGRIYNSPAEIYLERPSVNGATGTGQIAPPSRVNPGSQIVQAPLTAPTYQNGVDTRQGVRIYNAPPSVGGQPVIGQTNSAPNSTNQQYPTLANNAPARIVPSYQELPPSPTYVQPGSNQYQNSQASAHHASSGSFITVQPGDTVYAIARRTGHNPKDIIAINSLYPPYALAIGETLRMPGASVGRSINPVQTSDPYANDLSRTISYDDRTSYNSASSYVPDTTPQIATNPGLSREVIARDVLYTVSPGDTLYSIARRNTITVQSVASANRLRAPYSLSVGQQLLLPAVPVGQAVNNYSEQRSVASPIARVQTPHVQTPRVQTIAATPSKNITSITREASFSKGPSDIGQFDWPVKGSVISQFGSGGIGRRNDGINISAPQGTTVRASAAGEVIYRGSEINGYGKLLLIKHDGGYVTTYAHNDVMLVRKGQKVKKGQIIGKVGKSGSVNEPQLHFEIRHNTQSLDPLSFLASN